MARSPAAPEAVMAALRSGDDQAASEAMRGHVATQGERSQDPLAAPRLERAGQAGARAGPRSGPRAVRRPRSR